MPSCAVFYCKNNDKTPTPEKLSFFKFPRTIRQRKIWTEACKRKDLIDVEVARVCSRHFSEDCFANLMQWKLGNFKPILLPTATPTLNLNLKKDLDPKENPRTERCSKRSIRKNALARLNELDKLETEEDTSHLVGGIREDHNYPLNYQICNTSEQIPKNFPTQNQLSEHSLSNASTNAIILPKNVINGLTETTNPVCPTNCKHIDDSAQTPNAQTDNNIEVTSDSIVIIPPISLEEDLRQLRKKNAWLEREVKVAHRKLETSQMQIKRLREDSNKWRIKWIDVVRDLKRQKEAEINSRVLKEMFSPAQIRYMRKTGQRMVQWQKDDIVKALSVSAFGLKTYQFVREKLKYPLPGISTVRRWTSNSSKCLEEKVGD